MSGSPVDPKPLTDRMVALAFSFLVIAMALYFAVHLLERIAWVLIGLAVVTSLAYTAWLWHRRQRSGW